MRVSAFAFSLFAVINKQTSVDAYRTGSVLPLSSKINPLSLKKTTEYSKSRIHLSDKINESQKDILFTGDVNITRRRLYTEHKYVTYTLSEFSRFVAKIDFSNNEQISEVKNRFVGVKGLMNGHAGHENERIHELLRRKNSHVQDLIEAEHAGHDVVFQNLDALLERALAETDVDLKRGAGYQFYLEFQKFEAGNLRHQIYEETRIMPELHRFYSDEQILEQVDTPSYEQMTSEDLVGMMQELFPQFNKDDRYGMLNDIRLSQPAKFPDAFIGILPSLSEEEAAEFAAIFQSSLNLSETDVFSPRPSM